MKSKDFLTLLLSSLNLRHPRASIRKCVKLLQYRRDFQHFQSLPTFRQEAKITYRPILNDSSDFGGQLPLHYFFQDLWFANKVHAYQPARLIDIGSRIDGFVAHVAAFREIEEIDIRPRPARDVGVNK
jgi:hypothetical protein